MPSMTLGWSLLEVAAPLVITAWFVTNEVAASLLGGRLFDLAPRYAGWLQGLDLLIPWSNFNHGGNRKCQLRIRLVLANGEVRDVPLRREGRGILHGLGRHKIHKFQLAIALGREHDAWWLSWALLAHVVGELDDVTEVRQIRFERVDSEHPDIAGRGTWREDVTVLFSRDVADLDLVPESP